MNAIQLIAALGIAALAFDGAPATIGATASLIAQDEASPADILKTRLMSLDGVWEGQLEYRDFSSNEMVAIPLKRTFHASPGDNYVIIENEFTDPGYKVFGAQMIVPGESGLVIASSGGESVETDTMLLESVSEAATGFTAILHGTIIDAGEPALARYTMTLDGDQLRFQKDVKTRRDADYRFRNAFDVTRSAE
ncbi:hypothetical protein [Sphingomicrobium sediminis]|uniref:DUF1579 domain-containing protein n=1 Tax=Sphingomicrobium sediminis TaxID=2950949 RepID=A0A9X2EHX9_9SPHN|nr:hypothetical protein [Sphingomicrobium sediminis]MCM8557056.1 hypothetical protein [Sphingomicrobium sediminis]